MLPRKESEYTMTREITVASGQTAQKKTLKQTILRKRKILIGYTQQYELLHAELELVKREYYLRVGSLFTRDNYLDIEIIKYKNIIELIKKGFSYEEAMKKIANMYYSPEPEDYTFEPPLPLDGDEKHNSITGKKLKQLWKKAVMKFHPDLALDKDEKRIREEIMKKINNAYRDRDYELLSELYKNNHVKGWHETTVEELEIMLVDVENKIIAIKKELEILRKSEWNNWKKKISVAKKTGEDVFKELEDMMLDDIVRKKRILAELKKTVELF
jgi:hypothetical protein